MRSEASGFERWTARNAKCIYAGSDKRFDSGKNWPVRVVFASPGLLRHRMEKKGLVLHSENSLELQWLACPLGLQNKKQPRHLLRGPHKQELKPAAHKYSETGLPLNMEYLCWFPISYQVNLYQCLNSWFKATWDMFCCFYLLQYMP